jgi:hypothetical protein
MNLSKMKKIENTKMRIVIDYTSTGVWHHKKKKKRKVDKETKTLDPSSLFEVHKKSLAET